MDDSTVAYSPARFSGLLWTIKAFPRRLREWAIRRMLRAIVLLTRDSNLLAHARREMKSSLNGPDGPNRWMADGCIELLAVFVAHGHSGSSAPWCVDWFKKLALFEPLGPLTGAADEWVDHGYCMQNNRCSHVFKQADLFGGQAYDIYARVFREPNGQCFTSGESHAPITFPYTPKSEYVDVPESKGD